MFLVIQGFRIFFSILIVAMIFSAAAPARASSTAADEQAGAVLFRDKGCTHCHGVGGVGTKKAPSLVEIRKDKLWPPEKMTAQILKGGQKMPPFEDSVTDQEVAQLVAYLRAKHRPVAPPAAEPAESTPTPPSTPPQ
jgi:mono/diheme cytochrome c family protein